MKVLIAVLLTVNLFGNVSPDYITTNYYDPSVVISFDAWNSETLSVKIISSDYEVIFNDVLEIKAMDGIKYNLKNLSSGKYIIKLENETKLVEETVILFDGKIVEKDAKVYYKPTISLKGDYINTNFLSYNGEVEIKIFNSTDVLFEDNIKGAKPFKKVYNVKSLPKGLYTVTISNNKVLRSMTFNR